MDKVYCLWQITEDEFENPLEYLEGLFKTRNSAQKAIRECKKYAKDNMQDYDYKLTTRELEN